MRVLNDIFGSRAMDALEKGLGALALRHRVIANNIANVNTPGFKKSEVSFARELEAYLNAREAGAAGTGAGGATAQAAFRPRVIRVDSRSARLDGNNVDIEEEMTRLAENALLYEAVARQMAGKFASLRAAITEGRR